MDITAISIGLLIGAIIGVTIGYFILKKLQRKQEKELLYKAKIQAENIKKDKISFYLMIPYFAWSSYAFILNSAIFILN